MSLYAFLIENKELFKIIYALTIILICTLIVLKTNKVFRLSLHMGIRYFRNAFFFYGIAFFIRYILKFIINDFYIINTLFEFFLIMAGFFLLYSLIWKKIEPAKAFFSSLLNNRVSIFYLMALVLIILDFLWTTSYFMFFSQVIIFIFAAAISFINYRRKSHRKFPKFYFISMILILVAWILNALIILFFPGNTALLIDVYLLNAVFFLIFLYGVLNVTKK